jgi:hypothetical protein
VCSNRFTLSIEEAKKNLDEILKSLRENTSEESPEEESNNNQGREESPEERNYREQVNFEDINQEIFEESSEEELEELESSSNKETSEEDLEQEITLENNSPPGVLTPPIIVVPIVNMAITNAQMEAILGVNGANLTGPLNLMTAAQTNTTTAINNLIAANGNRLGGKIVEIPSYYGGDDEDPYE